MRLKLSPFVAAVAAVTLLLPFAASAQTQSSPSPAPTTAPVAKTAVSDQQITQAAVAMQKVMSIRQTYNQRM
ncbi:MAG: hypothetical protein KGL22_02525, partial [Alphaproteobacteria bacterium]|nr:hypothetical protein [Alphaproteobacteria bacterium]